MMYAALWRTLPGPIWVRILILLGLLAIVLVVLDLWVFPWIQPYLGPQEATVNE